MRNEVNLQQVESYLESLETPQLRNKWQDIALIYKEYLDFFAQGYLSNANLPKFTAEAILENGYFSNKTVYLYGFDQIRKSLRDILVAICRVADDLLLYVNLQFSSALDREIYIPMEKSVNTLIDSLAPYDIEKSIECFSHPLDSPPAFQHIDAFLNSKPRLDRNETYDTPQDNIQVFNGDSPFEEIKFVCDEVQKLLSSSIPISNIAIYIPDQGDYGFLLYSELLSRGLPFHSHEEMALLDHPLVKYLLEVTHYISNKHHPEYLMALLHNPFSPLTQEERSYLLLYQNQTQLHPQQWLKAFTRKPKQLPIAEPLRQKLILPLLALEKRLLHAKNLGEQAALLLHHLSREGLFERLELQEIQLNKYGLYSSANFNKQLLDDIVGVFAQIQLIIGDAPLALDELSEYLDYALQEASIHVLPPIDDSLAISTPTRALLNNISHLFLLGFNENLMATGEESLFRTGELQEFEHSIGHTIKISPNDLYLTNQLHIKKALTLPKEKLYICYSKTNFGGEALWPFPTLSNLEKRLFPKRLYYIEFPSSKQNKGNFSNNPSHLIRLLRKNLAEYCGQNEEKKDSIEEKLSQILHTLANLGFTTAEIKTLLGWQENEKILSTTAKSLFKTNTVSVSRLEQYSQCPYKHFLDYGLRPDKNEKWEPRSLDAGTFYHGIFEKLFSKIKELDDIQALDETQVVAWIDELIAQDDFIKGENPYTDNPLGQVRFQNMRRTLLQAGKTLIKFHKDSRFKTLATEYHFDEKSTPPFVLSLEDGTEIVLRGSVDKLDTFTNEVHEYLRILDYKSSHKELQPSELWYGSQLQLLLYLNVIRKHFPKAIPSGAFYFHINNPWIEDADVDKSTLEKSREKSFRFEGVLLSDIDAIEGMDSNLADPISIAKCINKDGSFSKAKGLLTEEELVALIEHCLARAKTFAEDMNAGLIQVEPIKIDAKTPCIYCEYGNICFQNNTFKELEKINFTTLKERLLENRNIK